MSSVKTGDDVRLNDELPELGLRRGQQGVVCSIWFSPNVAYEIEFRLAGDGFPTRVLLQEHQIEPAGDGRTN